MSYGCDQLPSSILEVVGRGRDTLNHPAWMSLQIDQRRRFEEPLIKKRA